MKLILHGYILGYKAINKAKRMVTQKSQTLIICCDTEEKEMQLRRETLRSTGNVLPFNLDGN